MKQFIFSLTTIAALTMCTSYNTNAQIITTVAGNGTSAYNGDHGTAINAGIHMPVGVSFDTANNLYISDNFNLCVRKVDKYGIITTFAGNGTSGYSGDGGPATAAQITVVGDVETDRFGNVFITDPGNDVIRKVDAAGIITTVAGNGVNGYSGDYGPATAAALNLPQAVTIDDLGNIYIADGNNNCIRKVDINGIIRTIAGNRIGGYSGDGGPATAALLNSPESITFDNAGNIYIADFLNNRIRKISTTGIISTAVGTGRSGYSGDGGPATAAKINGPTDVEVDNYGNMYIADGNNAIRKVNTAGIISTFAGTGHAGYSGDGGPATAAKFNNSECVAIDNYGAIYLADANNNRIRKIQSCASFEVSPIYGTTTEVCPDASITFSNNTESGVWSAGNSHATIVAGVLTGITAGTDSIYVSVSNMCGTKDTFVVVTVNALPVAGIISGIDSVCSGATTTLTSAATGGSAVWSTSNSNAIVLAGVVTGVNPGNDSIFVTVHNSCGINDTFTVFNVKALPDAGTITGSTSVCAGATTSLTCSVTSGMWSATNSNVSIAEGYITGIMAGVDTILYTVSNSCGMATAKQTIIGHLEKRFIFFQ